MDVGGQGMSQTGNATTATTGQLVNPPSWGRLGGTIARGVLFAPIPALLATLLFGHFRFELNEFLTILAFFVVGWTVVVALSSPWEPVLLITPTTISVSHWGARTLQMGSWRSYPMQPLAPQVRRGGRGGTWIQIYLVDATGWRHRVAFNMISLSGVRSGILSVGCTVY